MGGGEGQGVVGGRGQGGARRGGKAPRTTRTVGAAVTVAVTARPPASKLAMKEGLGWGRNGGVWGTHC